jgi:hypothetical protein
MTRGGPHQGPAAVVLFAAALTYVVAAAYEGFLIRPMVEGWILNTEAYSWWRLTSLYSVVNWLWMVVAALPAMLLAVAIARGHRAAIWAARVVAVVGLMLRLVASGANLLISAIGDARGLNTHQRVLLLFTGSILLTHAAVLALLRDPRGPAGAVEEAG